MAEPICGLIKTQLLAEKWSLILKSFVTLICLAFFIENSYEIFKQYFSKKTILAADYDIQQNISFPDFIICNFSAYKHAKIPRLDFDSYMNNTMNLSDVLIAITHPDIGSGAGNIDNEESLYNSRVVSEHIYIEQIFSYYRGNCYKLRYKRKVRLVVYR